MFIDLFHGRAQCSLGENMKDISRIFIGIALVLVVLGLAMPHAAAMIHYRRGIGLAANEQPIVLQRPGEYHVMLRLVVWPLWYYQENLATYDSVTLTLMLIPLKLIGHSSVPVIFGDGCTWLEGGRQQCTWTNVHLSQDEDGVTLDATLLLGIDFLVGSADGLGTYHLKLDATATAAAGTIIFEGHTFVAVFVDG